MTDDERKIRKRAYHKEWLQRPHVKAKRKADYQKNKQAIRAYQQEYYWSESNKEKWLAYFREYYAGTKRRKRKQVAKSITHDVPHNL